MKVAAAALMLASSVSVAQANSAQSLSLSKAQAARATTATGEKNEQFQLSPLVLLGGIVAVVAILELTGAINIFDDTPDSP
ncbi:hypothetical protein LRS12_13735 [Sphingomonas sp. J344]|nr:hypothetical protein [Sphingomonas sp. J344]MCR5871684.1 hypothetical protein [Sphingomonas sp. J344]